MTFFEILWDNEDHDLLGEMVAATDFDEALRLYADDHFWEFVEPEDAREVKLTRHDFPADGKGVIPAGESRRYRIAVPEEYECVESVNDLQFDLLTDN